MEEAGGGFERRGEVRYRRRGGTQTLRCDDLGGRSADDGRQRVTSGGYTGGRVITEAGTREEEDVRKKVATSEENGRDRRGGLAWGCWGLQKLGRYDYHLAFFFSKCEALDPSFCDHHFHYDHHLAPSLDWTTFSNSHT